MENKIRVKQISNLKKFHGWTDIAEFDTKYWECRYIDPKKLKMEFEVLIYNEVYVMYNVGSKDVFCVEIYNAELAAMQKQVFDYMWNAARKMRITDNRGAAEVI